MTKIMVAFRNYANAPKNVRSKLVSPSRDRRNEEVKWKDGQGCTLRNRVGAQFAQFFVLSLLTRLLQHSHYDNITRVVIHHKF